MMLLLMEFLHHISRFWGNYNKNSFHWYLNSVTLDQSRLSPRAAKG